MLDVPHFCVISCIAGFVVFHFTYLSIHVYLDNRNFVFGNAMDKEGYLDVERDEDRFITWISGTVVGN